MDQREPDAAAPEQSDAAVEFLTALQPQEAGVRRRSFVALLRALTREAQVR